MKCSCGNKAVVEQMRQMADRRVRRRYVCECGNRFESHEITYSIWRKIKDLPTASVIKKGEGVYLEEADQGLARLHIANATDKLCKDMRNGFIPVSMLSNAITKMTKENTWPAICRALDIKQDF